MPIKVNRKKDDDVIVKSPVEESTTPVKDFIGLLLVVISTPFIFIFSCLTGRIRSPVAIVIMLLLAVWGLYNLSRSDIISKRDIKTKIIQQTLEELTPEEKDDLRKEISTIRKSIDINIIPKPLYPIIDVPIDMLSINYLLFMLQSGYIQPDGSGSEFILDSYLHSNFKLLKEKSWEALQNIKTDAAARVINNYEVEMQKKSQDIKTKYGNIENKSTIDNLKDSIQDKLQGHLGIAGH